MGFNRHNSFYLERDIMLINMFAAKKSIIFISKSKVKITTVTLGKKSKETLVGESSWTLENLPDFFNQYKKSIKGPTRLLLSDDFVYIVLLSFSRNIILNPNIIRQKAQEYIPEDLNQTVWDFREIFSPPSSKGEERKVQVASVVKNLFEDLAKILVKENIHIEAIEFLSFSLLRLHQASEITLFVYIYDKAYLSLIQNNTVLSTERVTLPMDKDKMNKFIAFTKEVLGSQPKKIIFYGNSEGINLKEYENKNYKAEIQDISPTTSLAYKKDLKDNDQEILSTRIMRALSFLKNTEMENKKITPSENKNKDSQTPKSQKHSSSKFWLTGIALFTIIIIIEIILYFFQNILNKAKMTP